MSNEGVTVFKIPNGLVKPIEEGLTPIAKSFGESFGGTISTAWELAFGGLDTKLEKVRYKRQNDVQKFKNELDKKISEVPPENVIEAKMHVVGPVLEASKYYFEEESIRNMFSSLIASSIDNRYSTKVHPSFVEIIKQLSSYDAGILKLFYPNNSFGFAKYIAHVQGSSNTSDVASNVFIENSTLDNFTWEVLDKNSASLVNLERLGMIALYLDTTVVGYNYEIFNKTKPFREISDSISKGPISSHNNSNIKYESVKSQYGVTRLTQLGKDFLQICLMSK